MSEWITERADAYCDSVRDGTHDSPRPVERGRKLITSKHIANETLNLAGAKCISDEDYEAINQRSKVDVGDLLFSMIGTVGRVYRVDAEPDYAIKNMGLFKIGDELKSKYLFYYMQSAAAKQYIASCLAGSTQKFMSLSNLRAFPIVYPDDQVTMAAIVEVLDAIAQKYRLNQRTNDYLAELCEAIASKQTIADGILSDICTQVKDKVPCTEAEIDSYVSTESLLAEKGGRQKATSVPSTGKVIAYRAGDILVSNIRPYFKKIWFADGDGTCSGDVVVFRAKLPSLAPYLFSVLHSDGFFDYVMSGAKGTKMPRGDKEQMMSYAIRRDCSDYDLEAIASAVQRIGIANRENRYLSDLRDSLLPKLMSGEIDVSKVELPVQSNNHLF